MDRVRIRTRKRYQDLLDAAASAMLAAQVFGMIGFSAFASPESAKSLSLAAVPKLMVTSATLQLNRMVPALPMGIQ